MSFEYLKSEKLNKQADNQDYLLGRKVESILKDRDITSDRLIQPPTWIKDNLRLYAEYTEFTTNTGDAGNITINKSFDFPTGLFDPYATPTISVSMGFHGNGALKQINPIIKLPDSTGFTLQVDSVLGNMYSDDMNYFANIVAIAPGNMDSNPVFFNSVDWGDDTEQVQITSSKLNQMINNSEYLHGTKISPYLRNVNPSTKTPDNFIQYLTDKVGLYADYVEVNPDSSMFKRADDSDDSAPVNFTVFLDFPDGFFNPDFQPVVIANAGSKNAATNGAIRKIWGVLKKVRNSGFSYMIHEYSQTESFTSLDTYFVSFIAVGVRNIL